MTLAVTVMLLGKTGAGKSSLANALCRLEVSPNNFHFKEGTRESLERLTTEAQSYSTMTNGMRLRVIDTPGFFDTELAPKQRWMDILRAVKLAGNYLDAVIFVVDTKEVQSGAEVMTIIQKNVGELITDRMIIVFNHDSSFSDSDRIEVKRYFNFYAGRGTLGAKFVFMNVKDVASHESTLRKIEDYLKETKMNFPTPVVTDVFKNYTSKVLQSILSEMRKSTISMEDLYVSAKIDIELLDEFLTRYEMNEQIRIRNNAKMEEEITARQNREREEAEQRQREYQELQRRNLETELQMERQRRQRLERESNESSCNIL